ncbi:MAG: hypothetical protein HYX87_01790 [Chloroflexi bacterium]|nr:hypothetical protein [Chloroflexota bacterium]
MKGLKVFLAISFVLTAVFGLIGLFSPGVLSSMGLAAKDADPAYTRISSTALIGFALAMYYAFRDPMKNIVVVRAVIAWFALEAIVLLITGIAGGISLGDALPGIIFDAIIAAGLVIFYPRAKIAA